MLFIGDIVGKPGRWILSKFLPVLRNELQIDFVIANGENAAGGFGITKKSANKIYRYGIDVITSGNHIFDRKQEIEEILKEKRVIIPLNYVNYFNKGIFETEINGIKLAVLNIEGVIFMPEEPKKLNPFLIIDEALNVVRDSKIIIVDFHAEATAEKIAMANYLDGKVTAVIGTHTHVMTADERIMKNGTAYITDAGMTGPFDSVIGMDVETVIRKFKGNEERLKIAKDDIRMNGVLITADIDTGKAVNIRRLEIGEDFKR
uniref:TIGR00282 family metallophosphoesterase n=1 Tax=candidate division WOR-3 bacterium TaxID=2052148 RepID=A0A7C4Y6P3_UNCW3